MKLCNQVSVGILGTGSAFPEEELTNFDLERIVNTTDEWISKRTGISKRRILDKNTPGYKLGVSAAKEALKDAGIEASEIGLIIVSTETPDFLSPSTSCNIQREIEATNAAAFDLNAACSGFVYGLATAKSFIVSGQYKYVLLVGCEALTRAVDWTDRNTCVLFGDGAGAVVLGPVESEYGIINTCLGAEGHLGHNITIPCYYFSDDEKNKRNGEEKKSIWMDGQEVFKFAVKALEQATKKVLDYANMGIDDIKLVFPHQANSRILDGAARRLGISSEKIFTNLHKYGNISSASIPVALDEAKKEGLIEKGDNLVLVGFGGGLTWASALIRWSK